ncbi:hypothetical protein Tco_1332868, partial [Tanacetum coccineum]
TEAVAITSATSAPSTPVLDTVAKAIRVHQSAFHNSSFAGTIRPDDAGPSHPLGKELSMGSWDVDSETLHEVFVPQWGVSNDSLLDTYDASCDFIDHLAPPALFAKIRGMDYYDLFIEFNIGTALQACLGAEVRMRIEYCLDERKRLESKCGRQADLLKARDGEIESLKAQLTVKEAKAAEAVHLRTQVSTIEAAKKVGAGELDDLKQKSVALEHERDSLTRKITELQSSVFAKDLELKDVNMIVTSLRSQNDGLVDQVHALETTCARLGEQVSGCERLKEQIEEFYDAQMSNVNAKVAKLDTDLLEMASHLEEKFYPHLLTTISRRRWLLTHGLKLTSELSAGIDHGKEGRSLADVAAYNPATEADFSSALQKLRDVDFPLLAELKSHKDTSIEDFMNLLHLESPIADVLGMSDLQPDIEQLMLPIHRSPDQVVLGETSLSFALSVAQSRVERLRKSVTEERLSHNDATVPLANPLSAENDYEIADADGQDGVQGDAQGNVASLPSVEFEKERSGTTS